MAFVKPEDQENKIKGLSAPSKYRKNSFKRGKDGNVVVRGQFDNHYYSDY
tara:strand:+ start:328 stop:477 length:150 start_codon:yes stop_codon:yes gene_type:complete